MLAWRLLRLKLGFWLGKLGTFVGIIDILIMVLICYLIYIVVWPNAFFVTAVNINGIDFGGKNRVVLSFLALLALILAAVT